MKKIMLFILIGILLISLASAADWDNLKIYNEDENKYTLYNWNIIGLIFDIKLAEYELDYNTDQCLFNCHATGTAKLYQEEKLFDNLIFENKQGEEINIENYQIFIWKNITFSKMVTDYKEICEEVITENGTALSCENVKSGEHIEEVTEERLEEYNSEILEVGEYKWRIEGNKKKHQTVDWIVTAFGKKFTRWAWWDSDWSNCKNISINTEVVLDNAIIIANLTELTFDSTNEVRIVNTYCGNDGTEVKSSVLQNGSDWAYTTFLANLTGAANYSIYYNNFGAGARSDELNDDFCEFGLDGRGRNNYCGWTNVTNANYSIQNGVINISHAGLYSPTNVGLKSILIGYFRTTDVVYSNVGMGLTNGTGTSYILEGETAIASLPDARSSGVAEIAIVGTSGFEEVKSSTGLTDGFNRPVVHWIEVNETGGTTTNSKLYNSDALVWNFSASTTVSSAEELMHLYLGGHSGQTYSVDHWYVDYIRAYDVESRYVFEGNYSITIGNEEVTGISVTLNVPSNNTIFGVNEIKTNCSVIVFSGTLKNLSLYIDGSLNISDDVTGSYNESIKTLSYSDGSHEWTCSATDTSDSLFWADTNRTFSVDTTAPIGNITYPIDEVDYHIIANNLTINWSVSDTNLDSCWGSFDGGANNISLTCADNNLSINITSINNDTFTFYANDSFGNVGNITRTWIYKIFEFQQTFSPTTIIGSTETFVNNIFLGSGETITGIVFDYNGTEKSATSVSVGGSEYNFTSTFIIPSVPSITNMSTFWKVDLISGQINTTPKNQTVNVISVDNCSTYTNVIFNYTLIDEGNQSRLANNSKLELDITMFDESKTILLLNFSEEYDNINPALVCLSINLTNETVYAVDSTVKYRADNYSIEYYNIQNFLMRNSTIPQTINLFDLWLNDATEFQITFKDSNFVVVENALIQINRQYLSEGLFKTVEIPKTDSNGQTVAHLVEKDAVYNILVLKEREVLGTFNNIIAFCEDILIGSCFITLNALTVGEVSFDYDEDVGLFFDFDYNETSRNLQFDFTTNDGSVKNVTLSALKMDQLGNTSVCDGFLISASGSIFCPVPISVGNESIIVSIFVDGELKITNYISAGTEFDIGDAGYFLMFFLVLSLALMMTQSKTGVIVGVILGFISGVLLSFIKGGLMGIGSSVIWLIIMGVILIYKLNSQGQT